MTQPLSSSGKKPLKIRSPRKKVEPLKVKNITTLSNQENIATLGQIIEASNTGFLLIIERKNLIPKELRSHLNLVSLEGQEVLLHLEHMNLEISGRVARTQLIGKKSYAIGVDFSHDAPFYWREILFDLLPSPGEFGK